MCSAGLKARNFQARTEPIRLSGISNFPSIVKDELAVLQQGAVVGLPAETRITYDILLCRRVFYLMLFIYFSNIVYPSEAIVFLSSGFSLSKLFFFSQ